MEAAALYTFATEREWSVVYFAHVTNETGQGTSEFEKGTDGSTAALEIINASMSAWKSDSETA